MPIFPRIQWLLLSACLLGMTNGFGLAGEGPNPLRFAAEIAEFARDDQATGRQHVDTVFVGSSSIRMWDLATSFPEGQYLNRGFGGAETADILFYADQIAFRYQPRVVVYFCGVNDLANGRTATQVQRSFLQFVTRLHDRCPKTQLVVLAHKPSPARMASLSELGKANKLLAELCAHDPQLHFVADSYDAFIDEQGLPRMELHVSDGIHMSQEGYRVWTRAVQRALARLEATE